MSLEILAESESRLRRILNQLPALVWTVDRELCFRSTLGSALHDLGLEPDASRGASIYEFFGSNDASYAPIAAHLRALEGEPVFFEVELGSRRFRTYVEPVREDDVIVGVLGVAADVTAEHRATRELRRSEENLAMAQAAAHLGSWDHDLLTGSVTWSDELFSLCGLRAGAATPGPDLLWSFVHTEDATRVRSAFEAARSDGKPFVVDGRLVWPDGTERWVEHRGRFALDAEGRPTRVLGTVLDITARKQVEADLIHQAHYDPVTQLPNRKLFAERLGRSLPLARRSGSKVAVLFVDLDRFKTINDTLGHAVGDRFLRAAAERIATAVRETDTVARHGSDEFVVALVDIETADDAARVAQTLVEAFTARFDVEGREMYSSVSVGVSLFPDDGETVEELIRAADAALSRAKLAGGNGLRFYTAATHERAVERLTLENQLRRAVERDEFRLHYQPIVDSNADVVGVEALVRWQHPSLGLVFPDTFISLAEEIGLIIPMGRWIMRAGLAQMREWRDRGMQPFRLAINLSARQLLDPDLHRNVREALVDCSLPADALEMEITESAVLHDVNAAKRAVAQVKSLGVGFALDDFGTGYSALAYLKHFPVDALKIDRTFVRDLPADRGDLAIVSAIVALGHALDLRIVAEGVETAAQAALVHNLGCDEQQGYYYARPLPPLEIEALLRGRHIDTAKAASG
jgi:diguanylate cyclase (GGDEF)-like protein